MTRRHRITPNNNMVPAENMEQRGGVTAPGDEGLLKGLADKRLQYSKKNKKIKSTAVISPKNGVGHYSFIDFLLSRKQSAFLQSLSLAARLQHFNLSKLQFRKLQPFTMNPFIKDVTLFKNNSVSML